MTIVQTTNGNVRGSTDGALFSFKGIPYAEPIAGRARWLPPQPRRPWSGVLDAQNYGLACPQFSTDQSVLFPKARRQYLSALRGPNALPQGDDSLLLNVWSPSLDQNAQLPVMVFIHGGGFASGAANEIYDASPFAKKGVVAVVIQYRLGPPGFLHAQGLFDGEFCTNNRAFLDQICALKWVQENIARFGGDPSLVTIFGESAGAFSVFPLMASPLAKGLFRRAIPMGGMAQTCAPAKEYQAMSKDVLQDMGIAPGDEAALTALDHSKQMKLLAAVGKRVFGTRKPDQYGSLSREKVGFVGAATGTDFLPAAPLASYAAGTANDVDLMLGTCADDGQLFSLYLPLPQALSARLFMNQLRALMPKSDIAAAIKYYRAQMRGRSYADVFKQLNNDAFYRMPTIAAAEAHASAHPGRTYLYELDYQSAINGLGAIHGIDVVLLFGDCYSNALLHRDAETEALRDQMRQAWTSFAKTGKPSATGMPEWKPYDTNERAVMSFNRKSKLMSKRDENLRKFWAK